MTAIHVFQQRQSEPVCTDLIQMIRDGMIRRLRRFVVEPYDDGITWGFRQSP